MTNSYPSGRIFSLHRRTIMDSFSCVFFLWQLHLDLNMCYFIYYANITTFFDQEKVQYGYSLIRWRWNIWQKPTWKWRQDVKNDVRIPILTSCTRVVLHPSCKTTFPSPGRVHGNPGRVCKKKFSDRRKGRPLFFKSKFENLQHIHTAGDWKICSDDIYQLGMRGPLNLGPARRIAENPFLIVIGRWSFSIWITSDRVQTCNFTSCLLAFLAHLRRRLIGKLII